VPVAPNAVCYTAKLQE